VTVVHLRPFVAPTAEETVGAVHSAGEESEAPARLKSTT
jgi:hypothetical protein